MQPENTLLFRTTLTAPLPLPRRLSSPSLSLSLPLLLSETQTGSERGAAEKNRRRERRIKGKGWKERGTEGSASEAVGAGRTQAIFAHVKVAVPDVKILHVKSRLGTERERKRKNP